MRWASDLAPLSAGACFSLGRLPSREMSARNAPDADAPTPPICERQHAPRFARKRGPLWPRRIATPKLPTAKIRWTARVRDQVREIFETDCETFIVFNGTAANSLALASALPAVSQRSLPSNAPTLRRTNAARRSFFPEAPNCSASAGRTGNSTSTKPPRSWPSIATCTRPKSAPSASPRRPRRERFIRLTNWTRSSHLQKETTWSCTWTARVSLTPSPR